MLNKDKQKLSLGNLGHQRETFFSLTTSLVFHWSDQIMGFCLTSHLISLNLVFCLNRPVDLSTWSLYFFPVGQRMSVVSFPCSFKECSIKLCRLLLHILKPSSQMISALPHHSLNRTTFHLKNEFIMLTQNVHFSRDLRRCFLSGRVFYNELKPSNYLKDHESSHPYLQFGQKTVD